MKSEEFKKLVDLLEDESFREKVCACESGQDLKKLFDDFNIEMDAAEADEVFDELVRRAEGGELSADDLDAVVGGSILLAAGIVASGAVAITIYWKAYGKKAAAKALERLKKGTK